MIRVGSVLTVAAFASPAWAGNFSFISIDLPGPGYAYANAISDTNVVVGTKNDTTSSPVQPVGFAWVSGAITVVKAPIQSGLPGAELVGINRHGFAVGYYYVQGGLVRSFIYNLNNSKIDPIEAPSGYELRATAISDTDIIVGQALGASGMPNPAFIKYAGKPASLLGACPGNPKYRLDATRGGVILWLHEQGISPLED